MKVSHEIPKQLFSNHDFINDYPYVLAHLLDEKSEYYDEQYASFYKEKLRKSDFSILDNSAYELGNSIDISILHRLGEEYLPTHIVLPDNYGSYRETIVQVSEYLKQFYFKSTPNFFAVLQGSTVREYLDCYKFYCKYDKIDIIGINGREIENLSRKEFLNDLFTYEKVNKKIHLLGCFNPGEFLTYEDSLKKRIHSIDTSSPIIHGWLGNKFEKGGYAGEKPKITLADNLNITLSQEQIDLINYNVDMFRSYVK